MFGWMFFKKPRKKNIPIDMDFAEFRFGKKPFKAVLAKNFDIEPQEVFLDKLAQKKEKELGVSEKKIETPLSERIFFYFWTFCIFLLFILLSKTFQLQIIEGKDYLAQAEKNRFTIFSTQALRGIIYDSNMEQLVFNSPSFDLVFKKNLLPELHKKEVIKKIALILEKDYMSLWEKINESESLEIVVASNLDHQKIIVIESRKQELPGFYINQNFVRDYKEGDVFSHVIGYVGKITQEEIESNPGEYLLNDYFGKSGVERFYEQVLKRKPGKISAEKDAFGNIKSQQILSYPESGNSLVLHLEAEVQRKFREILQNHLSRVGASKGAVVALNPQNGAVISLISIPSYDNNVFSNSDASGLQNLFTDQQRPLFNRAISGRYAVGSSIKPLLALAALEEKTISPEKKIFSPGYILVPNPWNPDSPWRYLDWKPHGWVDMREAIAVSSNVYFYAIGGGYESQKGLGPTLIKKYLNLFGWGQKNNIDLPGEVDGLIPDPEWKKAYFKNASDQIWRDGDTYNLSIGQGYINVTPLQVATALSSVANGGTLFSPQVVKMVIDEKGNIIEEKEPEIINQSFVSPDSLEIVKQGMRQAVLDGSATVVNILSSEVAAKTGTAQTSKPEHYHNWLSLFAPYQNPEIALVIIAEDVKEIQTVALFAAQEMLEWYFNREELENNN